MSKKDLSGKIERLEAFEEKCAIRLENISAWLNEYNRLSVLFELYPKTGTTIPNNLKIVVAVYNNNGQIVETGYNCFHAENFWGFEVGNCCLGKITAKDISKIRIYPEDDRW